MQSGTAVWPPGPQSTQRLSHSMQVTGEQWQTFRRLIPTGCTRRGRQTAGWPSGWPVEARAR